MNSIAKYAKCNVPGPIGKNLFHVYIAEGINVVNVRTRRKVREHVMFMTTRTMRVENQTNG